MNRLPLHEVISNWARTAEEDNVRPDAPILREWAERLRKIVRRSECEACDGHGVVSAADCSIVQCQACSGTGSMTSLAVGHPQGADDGGMAAMLLDMLRNQAWPFGADPRWQLVEEWADQIFRLNRRTSQDLASFTDAEVYAEFKRRFPPNPRAGAAVVDQPGDEG